MQAHSEHRLQYFHEYPYRRGEKGEELEELEYIQLPTNAAVMLILGVVITLPPSLLLGHDTTRGCQP